jgi:hypothetical protein
MGRLYDYIVEVRELPRDAFARRHGYPFVIHHVAPAKDDAQWTFKTQTLSSTNVSVAQLVAREGLKLSPELARYNAYRVIKAATNPWPDTVSVGRARNNDIVLTDTSVSKLHAHFTQNGRGENFLLDAGSRNGTKVNDRTLDTSERVKLDYGDVLMFGGATLTFVDAGRLYDVVCGGIIG